MPFAATWMDLEITTLSKVHQIKTNTIRSHLYVESKKNSTNELIVKIERDSQTQKTILWLPMGKGEG